MIKEKKTKFSDLLCMVFFFCAEFAYASNYKELVSIKEVQKRNNEMFEEGVIRQSLEGNSSVSNVINYAYTKIGPTPACGIEDECKPNSESIIAFYISGGNLKKNILIDFMCDSIGVYDNYHNGMRDIHCGPDSKLIWNGSKYEILK